MISKKSEAIEKAVILVLWFGLLIGIRLLLGSEFPNSLAGTAGAVSITFGIFYLALKYTPFRKYAPSVRSALQDWYRQKFVLYSLLASQFEADRYLSTLLRNELLKYDNNAQTYKITKQGLDFLESMRRISELDELS